MPLWGKKKSTAGAVVHEFRVDRGWTMEELGRRCKLSGSQISKIEKGQEHLRIPTLERIARALGIKPCVFLMSKKDRDIFDEHCDVRY